MIVMLFTMIVVSCSGVDSVEGSTKRSKQDSVSVARSSSAIALARSKKDKNGDKPVYYQTTPPKRIVGSSKIQQPHSHHGKTYFLYGAEHLKLDNYYFDIPVVYNPAVKKWINYFLNRGRGFFERYSARAGRYAPILGLILEDHGLPRDLIFLAMAESGFQNNAKSWAKAVGPWQFMPYTGRRYGLRVSWYIDERRDPIKATIAASRYLKKLYKEFGAWELAAAAYNAGEGKMSRAIRRYKTENFWDLRKGRYLKSETKNYVPKIMALAILGKNLKSFGFEDIDFHEPLDFDEVDVPPFTDLMILSRMIGIPFEEIQRLNPEILRWYTPPNVQNYKLRIPIGFAVVWKDVIKTQDLKAKSFQIYKVRGRRSTLYDVAKKFKLKPKILREFNNIKTKKRLAKGTTVVLPFRQGQSRKDQMYADLYEKPRKSVLRRRRYRRRINLARRRGKKIYNPTVFYTVKKGDTLWRVAKRTGTSLDTLILSNLRLVKSRMIRVGDKLAIR
ncbi:MAG: transglycosylase SLT domain-containing protein [Bacteriovoracaceae bacterium]|nr:transglycosylase SLT domain-containing protein [Bacteriovoracaceae bacterium]